MSRRSAGAVSSRATNAKATSPVRSSRAAAAAAAKGRGPASPSGAAGGKGKGKGTGKGKKKVKIVEDPKDVRKLLAAAETDDVDTIKAMLELKEKERKVDIKAATGGEALQRATAAGKRNAVSALMSFGVRPEVNDGRAFQTAAALNALPLVELLLQREAENKVLDAAERARLIRLKKLRRKKKKQTTPTPLVNLPSTTLELTALHHAAMTGNIPVMAHLIRNKANINAQTHADNCGIYSGWTPLHFAADNGHLGAVRYLYQHGANLELPTHEGETACVLAAESGRFEVMKWLLSQGVDPRVPRRGMEAAQWAIYRGHTDAAEFAIGYGGLPELNQRQVWFPPRFSLKDVVVSEFSEALCRRVDTAVYKGEVKYRERLFRRDQIDDTRWLVDVYNPRELDPDKSVATAVERFPKHIITLIWLFEIEHTPW